MGGSGKKGSQAKQAYTNSFDDNISAQSWPAKVGLTNALDLGNWAESMMTGGIPEVSVDSSSGRFYGTTDYSGYGGGKGTTSGSWGSDDTGALQYTPSQSYVQALGPTLGTEYQGDAYLFNQASHQANVYNNRATDDYNRITGYDYALEDQVNQLLSNDVSLFGEDRANIQQARDIANAQLPNIDKARNLADKDVGWIDLARATTYGLESGDGLFGSQRAFIDQTVKSGQAAVQQKLASMGLDMSTQNAMLQNEVAEAGAATAGQLVQGNIQLSEGQQNLEQQLYGTDLGRMKTEADIYGTDVSRIKTEADIYGTDVSRYGTDVERYKAAQNQQSLDQQLYSTDASLGLSNQQLAASELQDFGNIFKQLKDTYSTASTAANNFMTQNLAPYGYILQDLATRSGVNVANAQNKTKMAVAESAAIGEGISSLFEAIGNIVGGVTGGGKGGMCWVAREVFGVTNPKWRLFRRWLSTRAPAWVRNWYLKNGEAFALYLRTRPIQKLLTRFIMEGILIYGR